ncbi:hypothetical protein SDC9_87103 [bioreactor metagenome]|uniref:Uncharacterized protein n=1 Tax=bioreactor metagenome TaxID=1076179 RepID=A0A644ZI12_9ZZZZ
MKSDYFSTIEEFREFQPARVLILCSLKEILPTKGNRFGFIISIILAAGFATLVGCSINTMELLSRIAGIMLNVQLAIFGCVFAVYSILLAFLSDGYMKRLAKIRENDSTSFLKQSTTYYESVLFLYFINIGLTSVVNILTECLNPVFGLKTYFAFDTRYAILFLFVYFAFSFRIFYELKSTIFNTLVLFRASIAYRFIDYFKEDDQNDIKN